MPALDISPFSRDATQPQRKSPSSYCNMSTRSRMKILSMHAAEKRLAAGFLQGSGSRLVQARSVQTEAEKPLSTKSSPNEDAADRRGKASLRRKKQSCCGVGSNPSHWVTIDSSPPSETKKALVPQQAMHFGSIGCVVWDMHWPIHTHKSFLPPNEMSPEKAVWQCFLVLRLGHDERSTVCAGGLKNDG